LRCEKKEAAVARTFGLPQPVAKVERTYPTSSLRSAGENEGKPARERLTLIRIFEELRALGYEGSYDVVRRYAKRWRGERGAATPEAYVPLSFAPGEAYQFD
jgi:hypothetical protein